MLWNSIRGDLAQSAAVHSLGMGRLNSAGQSKSFRAKI